MEQFLNFNSSLIDFNQSCIICSVNRTNNSNIYFSNSLGELQNKNGDHPHPPDYIQDQDCFSFWHLNKTVRCILKSPHWDEKAKKGIYPQFCFYQGFCKYFETKSMLERHFMKNECHELDTIKRKQMSEQWLKKNFPEKFAEFQNLHQQEKRRRKTISSSNSSKNITNISTMNDLSAFSSCPATRTQHSEF